jgi:hypothetical protein
MPPSSNTQQPNANGANSLQTYTKALLDPFDKTMSQPKLLDGKVARSSGIRLRATGEITCNGAGSTYIAMFPGHSNVICWRVDNDPLVPEVTPPPFQGHLDTIQDRSNVKATRTVGAALRLSLVNSADQNEGYWEAARIPSNKLDFSFTEPDPMGAPGVLNTAVYMSLASIDLSNHQTYITGKLRDIHRYQFKLNAIDNDIDFSRVISEPPAVDQFVSEQWDTVIIKIHGRVEVGAPSMLMYDCISGQEVIYKENTALARLMTTSPYVPQTKSLLTRTRFNPPGVQVS